MAFHGIQKIVGRPRLVRRSSPPKAVSIPVAPRAANAVSAIQESVVELHCVCALTNRAYVLQYRRIAGGKLRYLASEKLDGTIPPRKAGTGASVSAAQEVPMGDIEAIRFPCPWCGDGSINLCRPCGSLVCGGRKRGKEFVCRPSCGATWIGVPLETVEVSTRRTPDPQCSASPAPAGSALVLWRGGALKKR